MNAEHVPVTSEQLELAQNLFKRLAIYGATSDEAMVDEIVPLYMDAVERVPESERGRMLVALIELVEDRKISANCLMPFLFRDTSHFIISTATLHAAPVWPGIDDDPMIGVAELISHAHGCISRKDEDRGMAILAGLLVLGDRRVTRELGPCWRYLSAEKRQSLLSLMGTRAWAAIVDWLVDWMEQCEGAEFGAVAGAFARIPSNGEVPGIMEARRALPVWSETKDNALMVDATWSFRDYGLKLRPRLLQLAANEHPPRLMHDVLQKWQINHMDRLWSGVTLARDAAVVERRDLLPLIPNDGSGRSRLFSAVPLEDADFLSRDGQLLLCWSIFNPNGPTWSVIGRLPSEDAERDLLFYRMLNPFGQESVAVGILYGDDRKDGALIGDLIFALFQRNDVSQSGVDGPVLIGGGAPDHVEVPWPDSGFVQAIEAIFCQSPAIASQDIAYDIETLRAHWADPWAHAAAEREYAFSHMRPDGFVILPDPRPTNPDMISEWWQLITHEEHRAGQWVNFPGAWHGAIDHAPPQLAESAFTFFQLDDFLSRFGCTTFRDLAGMYTKAQLAQREPPAGR